MVRPTLSLVADIGDLTDYGREGISISRGSSSLVTTGFVADAGTYATTIDNIDRTFDPNFAAGPFFGDLVPGPLVFAEAVWEATTYPLFGGTIDGWPQSYPLNGKDQLIDFRATDVFQRLANAQLSLARPSEYTGARIAAVLADIGYPDAIDIAHGNSIVGPLRFSTVSALSHLTDVVQAEWGEFYVAADSTLVFRDRDTIASDTRSSVSQATFVQRNPATPYVGLQYSDITMGSPPIVNECVVVYSDTGRQVTIRDEVSIAEPWSNGVPRSLNLSVPLSTSSQARAYARWIVDRYANPLTTFTSITLTPTNEPGAAVDLWQQALTRELGDLITVTLDPLVLTGTPPRPAPSGAPITRDCWIRGITHDITAGVWATTFYLQDASWLAGLFYLDVSELDGPDVLGM